jgi:hypothetical protein
MRDFESSLMRSEIGWNPKGPQDVYRLLFRPEPSLFIHVEAGDLVVYAGDERQVASLRTSLLSYVLKQVEEKPKFMLIDVHSGGAFATPVELGQVVSIASSDLPLLYGQDFPFLVLTPLLCEPAFSKIDRILPQAAKSTDSLQAPSFILR